MYKDFLTTQQKDQVLKGQRLEQVFLQIRYANGEKAHEKIINMLAIREMEIKVIMKYHITFTFIIKKWKITNLPRIETQEPSLPLLFPLLLAIFQGFK